MDENLLILRGSETRLCGKGRVSMRVIFSNGRVERSDVGRFSGEQPTKTCRRCEFEA